MDSNSEDREYHSLEHAFPQNAAHYKVTYTHRRNTPDVSWVTHKDISVNCMLIFVLFITKMCLQIQTVNDKNEDFNKKRLVFMFVLSFCG